MRIECDSCFEEKQTLLFLDKPEYLEVGNFKRKKYLFLGGKLIVFSLSCWIRKQIIIS